MFPQAYDDDHLEQLLDANDAAPDWVSDSETVERITEHARGRADGRGEENALSSTETECLIVTNWNSFTDDWGFSDGTSNQAALGIYNEEASSGKNADLFTDVVILQSGWLKSGDGRLSQSEYYEDEEWDDATPGEMWIPVGAQDYICIIELTTDLIHGEPTIEDMM